MRDPWQRGQQEKPAAVTVESSLEPASVIRSLLSKHVVELSGRLSLGALQGQCSVAAEFWPAGSGQAEGKICIPLGRVVKLAILVKPVLGTGGN